MSVIITPSDIVRCTGDSITDVANIDWVHAPTGFADRLKGNGHRLPVAVSSYGVSGAHIADMDTDFTTWVPSANNTTVLLIELGVNDAVSGTSGPTYAASLLSIVNKALALNANMKFLIGSIMCYGELWIAGPSFSGNAHDSDIATLNTVISDQVTALKAAGSQAEYIDWRTPLLGLEGVRNGPAASSVAGGRCMHDFPGIHPAFETRLMMADAAMAMIDLRT